MFGHFHPEMSHNLVPPGYYPIWCPDFIQGQDMKTHLRRRPTSSPDPLLRHSTEEKKKKN